MDARELTEKYYKMSGEITELKKTVDYLEQETQKLRRIVSDLQIDIKMMGGRK